MRGNLITQSQLESDAIHKARNFILERYEGFAYPVVEQDDDGNYLPYEPGCVPWIVCENIVVKDGCCAGFDVKESFFTINVETDIDWSGSTSEPHTEYSESAIFEVYVGLDNGELSVYEEFDWIK